MAPAAPAAPAREGRTAGAARPTVAAARRGRHRGVCGTGRGAGRGAGRRAGHPDFQTELQRNMELIKCDAHFRSH